MVTLNWPRHWESADEFFSGMFDLRNYINLISDQDQCWRSPPAQTPQSTASMYRISGQTQLSECYWVYFVRLALKGLIKFSQLRRNNQVMLAWFQEVQFSFFLLDSNFISRWKSGCYHIVHGEGDRQEISCLFVSFVAWN